MILSNKIMVFCKIWYLHVVKSSVLAILQSFLEWLLGSQALQVLVAFCSTALALQRNLLAQIFLKVWIIKSYVMAHLTTCNQWESWKWAWNACCLNRGKCRLVNLCLSAFILHLSSFWKLLPSLIYKLWAELHVELVLCYCEDAWDSY